jgi:hypothetical protein
MTRLLAAISLAGMLASGVPVLAQVQLDHGTAQKLSDLGIDTSQVTDQDDVGYINQILASDADDATKKAEIMKLLEEN